nr:hypothetical protein Iba_chr07cCG9010 [Ipomoea batatas]
MLLLANTAPSQWKPELDALPSLLMETSLGLVISAHHLIKSIEWMENYLGLSDNLVGEMSFQRKQCISRLRKYAGIPGKRASARERSDKPAQGIVPIGDLGCVPSCMCPVVKERKQTSFGQFGSGTKALVSPFVDKTSSGTPMTAQQPRAPPMKLSWTPLASPVDPEVNCRKAGDHHLCVQNVIHVLLRRHIFDFLTNVSVCIHGRLGQRAEHLPFVEIVIASSSQRTCSDSSV